MINFSINPEHLKDFSEKCDILCASKLILADKKISNLLKTIASSQDLCKFLERCLNGFNYKTEFLKSKQPDGKKQGKYIINLPENENLVAFVFCLLCEFENKEKDLTDFLTEYYGFEELFNDGFANFCSKVILPFKNTVLYICENEEKELKDIVKPVVDQNIEEISFERDDFFKIVKFYKELTRNISKESRLNTQERTQYLKVAGAFLTACENKDAYLTQVLLIALKFMCRDYRFLNNKILQIEKIFDALIAKAEKDRQ